MIIHRSYNRSENDDFELNVSKNLNDKNEALPLYSDDGILVAWKIQKRYD